jgi:hypothetical protein
MPCVVETVEGLGAAPSPVASLPALLELSTPT